LIDRTTAHRFKNMLKALTEPKHIINNEKNLLQELDLKVERAFHELIDML
jgi:hypothetical protein